MKKQENAEEPVYHGGHRDLFPKDGPVSYTWDWEKVTHAATLKRKPVKPVGDISTDASVPATETN